MSTTSPDRSADAASPVRWGFVGTGRIAGWMADVVRIAPSAVLTAVASRSMGTAQSFAARHGAARAFDDFSGMLAWNGIDAVYVATPSGLREDICVAAAEAGKHVLGEKPFVSLPSLERITAACRRNGVCFMDATHFVHHPRYTAIREGMSDLIGTPQSLDSNFLVCLNDRRDIRYDPSLEPLGALGDLGWYNMRATLEYFEPVIDPPAVTARLVRDEDTGTLVAGEGSLKFANGRVSTWRCSFLAEAVDIRLELDGPGGTLLMDNFVGDDEDASASYRYAGRSGSPEKAVRVDSTLSGAAMMFEDFAAAVADATLREAWTRASERTQAMLDAIVHADPAS